MERFGILAMKRPWFLRYACWSYLTYWRALKRLQARLSKEIGSFLIDIRILLQLISIPELDHFTKVESILLDYGFLLLTCSPGKSKKLGHPKAPC